ncbi:hypothetical protein [Nocardia sp. NPDC059228]|uniref:hypothetical protein n=1 Tax=Nocardia sp. NPDC059228 TaxID=3346777 RepID=UPI0036891F7E
MREDMSPKSRSAAAPGHRFPNTSVRLAASARRARAPGSAAKETGGAQSRLKQMHFTNYVVTVELSLAAGDQHIVASQKNADGTTSQQSTDFRSNGTTGSSVIPNPIETILNGLQTGSTGGRVVSFGVQ